MTGINVSSIIYALVFGAMVVFAVKYVSGIFKAWALGANEKQYRLLAEKIAATQSESQATLSALQADFSRLASSLAQIEKILKQVE